MEDLVLKTLGEVGGKDEDDLHREFGTTGHKCVRPGERAVGMSATGIRQPGRGQCHGQGASYGTDTYRETAYDAVWTMGRAKYPEPRRHEQQRWLISGYGLSVRLRTSLYVLWRQASWDNLPLYAISRMAGESKARQPTCGRPWS